MFPFRKDLFKALEETNKHGFSEEELSKYTTDVLKCLHMLKKETIIHGDIKPVGSSATEQNANMSLKETQTDYIYNKEPHNNIDSHIFTRGC